MKPVPGICDRCGTRWDLSELRFEYVLGRKTNLRTCPDCYDESHPQLDTRNIRTSDEQTVKDSRPETLDSRGLYAYNPVGGGNASTFITTKLGRVAVNGS